MIRRFARPYARALSEVVTSPAEARKILDELTRFEEARKQSRELVELFNHPGVGFDAKQRVIAAIGKRLQVSPLGQRVLDVLARNHRINELGAILDAWREMLNRAEGIALAEVRVAQEISDAEQERLRRALESRFGQRVELQVSVDPSLLGGFVARVGSDVYDASITGRIQKFRAALHEESSR